MLAEQVKKRNYPQNPGVAEEIIFKRILNKEYVRMYNIFIWQS